MVSYVVAITGASGAVYGTRLIEELLKRGADVECVISPSGFLLLSHELGIDFEGKDVTQVMTGYLKEKDPECLKGGFVCLDSGDLTAGFASGSSLRRAMVVCPASMGTIARIACGISSNLIERAADCMLKEGGRLVLVPRETPLNMIHLENMLTLTKAGATVLPAMPGFYHKPETIADMVDFVVGKTLDCLCIENDLYKRWTKES